ncbi:hypothetical protein GCM10018785_11270 [Streptomyces longispororuber]|uniref:Uncharacterized protein n=1 Tax=Streptomyces longispororuber TaxID=68230 RepID=A0A918ZAA6_9ACTN|nr:hypothetical protein [Streptomyces longispororuber]GHE43471.1 hypothetical protein GCM10018785_11270 [Streptomyces longispororuber]
MNHDRPRSSEELCRTPDGRSDGAGGRLACLIQHIADSLHRRGYRVQQVIEHSVEDGFGPQVVVKVAAATYINISCRNPPATTGWCAVKLTGSERVLCEELCLSGGGKAATADEIVDAGLKALDLPAERPRNA